MSLAKRLEGEIRTLLPQTWYQLFFKAGTSLSGAFALSASQQYQAPA